MSLTLSSLRAILRRQLTSVTEYPNTTLDGWLSDGVRAYSLEFPRRLRQTLTLTSGKSVYDLPGGQDFVSVLRVEYPAGESPAVFLWQTDEGDAEFQNGGYAYALRAPDDSLADELDVAAGQIVFAQTVTTGETANIEYEALHAIPVAGDDDAVITIPTSHVEALIAFCEFRQAAQLNNDARWMDCIANDKLTQLSGDARQTWERYRGILADIRLGIARPGRNHVSWNRLGLE
jgi:hypothetical protein